MTIIDRYILRSFIKTYVLWFVCFIGIYVVFDLFTKMDGFNRVGGNLWGTVCLIVRYYMIQALPFFDKISALLCLTAAMVTLSMMMVHNEFVPILAAGISQRRIIRPIIGIVIILALGSAVARELLLPRYIDEFMKEPKDYAADSPGSVINETTDYRSCFRIHGSGGFTDEKKIVNPVVTLLDRSFSQEGKQVTITAKEGFFQDADEHHPAGYLLKGVEKSSIILTGPTLQLDGRSIVYSPRDTSWLGSGECFVASGIPFDYIAHNKSWLEYASTAEYIRAFREGSLDLGDDVKSVVHSRFVQPFLDMTLLFLGLPILLRRSEGSVFKTLGIVALVTILFLVVQVGSLFFGRAMGQPVLGAWFPLMLFTPIAVYFFRKIDS